MVSNRAMLHVICPSCKEEATYDSTGLCDKGGVLEVHCCMCDYMLLKIISKKYEVNPVLTMGKKE